MERSPEYWAEKVFSYRVKHNLTQTEMGELLGITYISVHRIENCVAKSISAKTLAKLQKILEK